MWAEVKHTLHRLKLQILAWSMGISLFSILLALLSTIDSGDQIFFRFSPLIFGGYAVKIGAEPLERKGQRKILTPNPALPLVRSRIFWGRLFGYLLSQVLILTAVYICWVGISSLTELGLTAVDLIRPFISLLGILVFFHSVALFLSTLFSSLRLAGLISAGLLGGNFLLEGLATITPFFGRIANILPLALYHGVDAVGGINFDAAVITLELICLLLLLAWWRVLAADKKMSRGKLPAFLFFPNLSKIRKSQDNPENGSSLHCMLVRE